MIGIITVNRDTFTNPTLDVLLKKLNDEGIKVALFNDKNQHFKPSNINNIIFFDGPKGYKIPKRPDNFINYLIIVWNIVKQIKSNKITNLIAVDPVGLILAGRIKRIYNHINIHYFSFEIFFTEEVKNNPIYASLKKKEIFYSKYVTSIVIQDEERKRCLIEENNISSNFANWYLIPVAPIVSKQTKLYDRAAYGLKEEHKVYIHSGSVAGWSGIKQIIKAIEDGLPKDTFIFIHSRFKFETSNVFHQKLFQLSSTNHQVILHDEIFNDYNDYLSFLKMFDYGLVLYESDGGIFTGNNIKEIGLSSGKFSTYMAVGLPSLLANCTTYTKLVKSDAIGAVLSEEEDLSFHIKNQTLSNFKKATCMAFYERALYPELLINSFITNELKD
jgi:hypothetical protein